MSQMIFRCRIAYFFYESVWVIMCVLLPIYLLAYIINFETLINEINKYILEFILASVILILLRGIVIARMTISFEGSKICVEQGMVTGNISGASCFSLKEDNIEVSNHFVWANPYFEAIKIQTPKQDFWINSLMFSKYEFMLLKQNIFSRLDDVK